MNLQNPSVACVTPFTSTSSSLFCLAPAGRAPSLASPQHSCSPQFRPAGPHDVREGGWGLVFAHRVATATGRGDSPPSLALGLLWFYSLLEEDLKFTEQQNAGCLAGRGAPRHSGEGPRAFAWHMAGLRGRWVMGSPPRGRPSAASSSAPRGWEPGRGHGTGGRQGREEGGDTAQHSTAQHSR